MDTGHSKLPTLGKQKVSLAKKKVNRIYLKKTVVIELFTFPFHITSPAIDSKMQQHRFSWSALKPFNFDIKETVNKQYCFSS